MPLSSESQVPPPGPSRRVGRFFRWLSARDSREHIWAFLDFLDAKPALKKSLILGVPAFAVAVGIGVWGYQHWAQNNSIRIARQWLEADRLDRAGIAVQDALANEPELPEAWRLASELAWRKGNRSASADYAKRAAVVGRYQSGDVLAWAEASILSDDVDQAKEALSYLDPSAAKGAPRALRLAGEIARRAKRFSDARDQFQAALAADAGAGTGVLAFDEVPLGIVCLQTGLAEDHSRGLSLLGKWASDAKWGAEALRALLADAEIHHEQEATSRWAEALRVHPLCTLGDIPVCLRAFADSDPVRYQTVLAALEEKSRASPAQSAQLLGWLTGIGQGQEAIRWGGSLDPSLERKPPIALGIAEALRATRRWTELQAWVDQGDWGRELGFLAWAYGMVAARELGDASKADALWRSLLAEGGASPAHALFAGDSLYAWGYAKEAAELLWEAADRPDLAYQSLGTLARLYQEQRDAVGQFRAFSRLNAMRPDDRAIANNFVYFAALTDLGSQSQVERIASNNFTKEPGNDGFRSTYAFVLVWEGKAARAMALMEPVSRNWRTSPAVAFAYGATLASLGRKSEAKEVLESINPNNLNFQEVAWIRAALR